MGCNFQIVNVVFTLIKMKEKDTHESPLHTDICIAHENIYTNRYIA